MKNFSLSILATLVFMTGSAFAQSPSNEVRVKMTISQPTLLDKTKQDTFDGSVDDASGTTSFKVICSAGADGKFVFDRVDESCSVSGNGVIKNPNNPSQTLPRINYSGGFRVNGGKDGYTDASTLVSNYLRVGTASAENSSFKGSLVMMPEKPSASAIALRDRLLKRLSQATTGTKAQEFDKKIDSVRFNDFVVPHVGLGNSQPCSWTGDLIYAYVNEAWQGSFTVKCGDENYKLEGNMPLIKAAAGAGHQEEYRLNLVVAGKGSSDPFASADPFATVNGVVGTMQLKNSGHNVEGVFVNVTVTGDLKGTGVPLELTRSFGQIMIIFARTFFGA
jgi:hypothetical protein